MKNRVEIFKNNQWIPLVLSDDKIKYNVLCNKIGEIQSRRISHSDTFTLPYVSENIIALDINVFSPTLMAQALNRRYKSRYYVKDKLLQTGFLVINNTVRGEINVNFFDEALVIVDEWDRNTFKQLLNKLVFNPELLPLSIVSDSYMEDLISFSNWETDRNKKVLNTTSSVCQSDDPTIEGFVSFILKYPNALNNIGDLYQIDSEGIRRQDHFNPYQSRPIFSMFSFLYLICQSFGYKLRLDNGVDIIALRDHYLCGKGIAESGDINDSLINSNAPTIVAVQAAWLRVTTPLRYDFEFYFNYANTQVVIDEFGRKTGIESVTPTQINYFPNKQIGGGISSIVISDVRTQHCVVKIESNPYIGNVIWEGSVIYDPPSAGIGAAEFLEVECNCMSLWKRVDGTVQEVIFNLSEKTLINNSKPLKFKFVGDKSQLNNTPAGTVEFIGLVCRISAKRSFANAPPPYLILSDMKFIEQVLPKGVTNTDSYGQMISNRTNLFDFSPDTSIKELLKNVLQQQGLLMSFEKDENGVQNIVKLFTYGAYRDRIDELRKGELKKYYDWSEYHQRLVPPLFNTDYGTEYGELNEIGLTDPFPGNIGRIQLATTITSKGYSSKLIPLAKNQTSAFKDVVSVNTILDTEPFFQYENLEQGLVRCSFNEFLPGVKKQYNAEQAVSTINSDPIPRVSNVIYSDDYLPAGIKEWYLLVDEAVRAQATFILPLRVIQSFDISIPVYIESLSGFYIVEQIGEYIDNLTPVKVDLIKIPLGVRKSVIDYSNDDYSNDYYT